MEKRAAVPGLHTTVLDDIEVTSFSLVPAEHMVDPAVRGAQLTRFSVGYQPAASARALPLCGAPGPDTYGPILCTRQGPLLYDAKTLPAGFSTWRAYRDHLLATAPISEERRARFTKRFAGQGEDERVYQGQCRQILLGDHENNVPVVTARARAKKADKFARWRKLF